MFALKVDTLNEVEPAHREFYENDPAGDGFRLRVTGLDKLKNEAKRFKERSRQLEAENAQLRAEPRQVPPKNLTPREQFFVDAEKRLEGLDGDERALELAKIETELEGVIQAEVSTHQQSFEKSVTQRTASLERLLVTNTARRVMRDLAKQGCAQALEPHIVNRLTAVQVDGFDELQIRVLGADGKPSAMTLDDLTAELRNTPAFAPLIMGASETDQAQHAAKVAQVLGQSTQSVGG